jgi:hypothetical protein
MIDTFQSLMILSPPQFESLYLTKELVESMQESWDELAWTRFAHQHDGFEFLDDYKNGSRLRQIVCHIRILLQSHAVSVRNPRQGLDLMLMVHARRSLQHDALCLEHGTDCIFEVARLACIMFLAELGWTLPVVGGFQKTATQFLLQALKRCMVKGRWRIHSELLLWATVVGGLAARQTPRAQDFARLLHQSVEPVTKDSWAHVKSVSHKFLPFEFELTSPCHVFWDQACELLSAELTAADTEWKWTEPDKDPASESTSISLCLGREWLLAHSASVDPCI